MRTRRRTARRRLCSALVRALPWALAVAAITLAAGLPVFIGTAVIAAGSLGLFRAAADERRNRPRTAKATARLAGFVGGAGIPLWVAVSAWNAPPLALALPVVAGVVILLGGLSGKPAQSAVASALLLAAGAVALV